MTEPTNSRQGVKKDPPPTTRPFWTYHLRREIQFLLDLSVLVAAFCLAYLLRFEFSLTPQIRDDALVQLPMVVLVQLAAIFLCGIYSFIWRYIGMAEMQSFILAALFSALPLLALRFGLPPQLGDLRVPISIIVMDTAFAFGGVLGIRILRRSLYERFESHLPFDDVGNRRQRQQVLLFGAGRAGLRAVRALAGQAAASELQVVGFVDDDPHKVGSVLHGIKVLGTSDDLPELISALDIDQVLLTMVRVERRRAMDLVDLCRQLKVEVRIMPSLFEILEGRLSVSRFRKVRIEDLLGREQVQLEDGEDRRRLTELIGGARVMVTGAGGSIGSELARQAALYQASRIILVERAEPALFEIDRQLRARWPNLEITARVADVADDERMRTLLQDERPQLILHAAAHKHVPLMELNPTEAIKNNTLATHRLGRLAGEAGIERFVLISTDKAVRPASVMGASKRLAEILLLDLEKRFATRYMAVRFGNVLGSTGSVIPIFREQIEAGGPVTVTHPEMTRFFMTIPEAAQLVLHAAGIGEGGEIFVLDMGRAVKIVDLANDMIRLAGLRPGEDIAIEFTGTRPGEKLFEELELENEHLAKTGHPKIFIGQLQPYSEDLLLRMLDKLRLLSSNGHHQHLRNYLQEVIPEANLELPAETQVHDKDAVVSRPSV